LKVIQRDPPAVYRTRHDNWKARPGDAVEQKDQQDDNGCARGDHCREIEEDRLLATIQKRLGSQVRQLLIPPIKLDESKNDPGAPSIGVPVAPFPRWMRCPLCDTLATIDSGVFRLKQDQWRPDRTEYRHEGCTKAKGKISPSALSVRFLLACREGHLTDLPWLEFVHKGNVPCKPAQLTLREYGISGDASDIIVQCLACNSNRRMSDAFDQDAQFRCPGHHPHLRRIDLKPCDEVAKSILLGASNSWFSVSLSALSIQYLTSWLQSLPMRKMASANVELLPACT
jgi:hypothetical protein